MSRVALAETVLRTFAIVMLATSAPAGVSIAWLNFMVVLGDASLDLGSVWASGISFFSYVLAAVVLWKYSGWLARRVADPRVDSIGNDGGSRNFEAVVLQVVGVFLLVGAVSALLDGLAPLVVLLSPAQSSPSGLDTLLRDERAAIAAGTSSFWRQSAGWLAGTVAYGMVGLWLTLRVPQVIALLERFRGTREVHER